MTSEKPPSPGKVATSEDDDLVDLLVGGFRYTASLTVLLSSSFHSSDDLNYFQALLSDRWKRRKLSEPIEIPDVDGRLFFYVLYFLQVGQLPRNPHSSICDSLLSQEDVDGIQMQGDYFGLTGLVDLCKDINKGVGGTGSLELTDFSNFAFVTEDIVFRHAIGDIGERYNMRYNYRNKSFCANLDFNDYTWSLNVTSEGQTILSTERFGRICDIIESEISLEHDLCNKDERDEMVPVTFTRVWDKVHHLVPPEAKLWFAFFVNDFILFYDGKGNFLEDWDSLFLAVRGA